MIDVHSHWVSAGYVDRVRTLLASSPPALATMLRSISSPSEALTSLPARVSEMDRAGAEVSVLSLPPPGVIIGPLGERAELCRLANDDCLEAASAHPGRFCVLVAIPLPLVDESLAELDRVARHPLARGVNLQTAAAEGWTIDHPSLEPVFTRAAELGLPVLSHPAIEPLLPAWGDFMLGATLAPMVSSSLGVARIVLSGTLDRIPGLDVIVPHLGGVLPYLTQRFDDFGPQQARQPLSWYLRHRLYLDTCSFHPPAFRCAVETSGVDRLVVGTDYPIRGPLQRARDDVTSALTDPDEQARVLRGTARRWFSLDDVAPAR